MNTKQVQVIIDRLYTDFFTQYPQVKTIVDLLCEQSAVVFLVGGAVRDAFLNRKPKDFDIEVHKIDMEGLQGLLSRFGSVDEVGKAYGVLRLRGLDVEWSVPREDCSGRKPIVTLNPALDIKKAFARRDLTMNAMGLNLCTRELYDPFGGLTHMQQKLLVCSDSVFFEQDPLRFFRVMQFISRFDMYPDEMLTTICKNMSIDQISRERIEEEFSKMFLRSERPSLGIRWIESIGRLHEILPALQRTVGIEQRADYHPEGDVFEHSMQTLDAAARIAYASDQTALAMCWAATLHDIGKPDTTVRVGGVLRCPEHAEIGATLARDMLRHLIGSHVLRKKICTLIEYHMRPINLTDGKASLGAYKRLAYALCPQVTMRELTWLRLCDLQGRNPREPIPFDCSFDSYQMFIGRAREAGVLDQPEQPVLSGSDLVPMIPPGPILGDVLKRVYQIQIDTGINNKELLLMRAKDIHTSLSKKVKYSS